MAVPMRSILARMKAKHWRGLIGLASALSVGLAGAQQGEKTVTSEKAVPGKDASAYQAWGYQPWWMSAYWPAVDLEQWQRVIFFELPVEEDGSVRGETFLPAGGQTMAQQAARCGTALDLAFSLFDEKKFEQIFSSSSLRSNLLRSILALVQQSGAKGVHLDVEIYKPVSEEAVQGYRDFVHRLKRRLHDLDSSYILSIFGVVGAAQDLLDKATLTQVDYVVVQGYDAHWKAGPKAGSVAPLKGGHDLSWEKSLRYYLNLGVERSRLLFSVPYFGYEWPVTSEAPGSATTSHGKEMSYAPLPPQWVPNIRLSALEQSRQHGAERDPQTGSPYYTYQDDNGSWWQGWYEDEESLSQKLDFIEKEGLAGVAVFPLGYDAGKFDELFADKWGKHATCYAAAR